MYNYIKYRGSLYREAQQDVPSPDTIKMIRTKFKQTSPKKRTPDISEGDEVGEFMSWLQQLFDLPVTARTAAQENETPAQPGTEQPTEEEPVDDQVAEKEKQAIKKIENLIRSKLASNSQITEAIKAIYDYVRSTAKSPKLDTIEGKEKFAKFVASLRALYMVNTWLNETIKTSKQFSQ